MKLDVLDAEAAFQLIAREFGIKQAPQGTRAAIISEHIRAVVMLGVASAGGQPVSKLKVVHTVHRRAAPLLEAVNREDELEQEVRTEVKHLLDVKDLVETPEGLTLAPARLVSIDDTTCLLIGGGPVQSLPLEIRSAVQVVARARIVSVEARNRSFFENLPRQSSADWLSAATADPVAWSEALKSEARKNLTPAHDVENPEILENGFWRALGRVRSFSDLAVVRYKQGRFARYTYALATIAGEGDAAARISMAFELAYDDARRLQGCASASGYQPAIHYVRAGAFVEVKIGHPLARPESQFLSLGWFTLGKPPNLWPRHYRFPLSLLPLLELAFVSLGFVLTEVSTLGKNNERQ